MASDPYTYWSTLSDDELTVDNVTNTLGLVQNDLWATAAVADRVVNDVEVQQTLLKLGIARTDTALKRSREATSSRLAVQAASIGDSPSKTSEDATGGGSVSDTLHAYFDARHEDAQLCNLRATLLHRLDRLNTFVEISKGAPTLNSQCSLEDEVEDWEDDPWADETTNTSMVVKEKSSEQFPIPLSSFLVEDLYLISCQLASWQWFEAVHALQARHHLILWPLRLAILDNVPEHVHPTNFRELLPAFDVSSNLELKPTQRPWRVESDWSELSDVQTALKNIPLVSSTWRSESVLDHALPRSLLTADDLSKWYKSRVDKIINASGLIDIALATIQHGASQGIPDLDEIGEELSLLSRLVYDTFQGPEAEEDWTLHRWYSMEPSAVVKAYLANSTSESVSKDISRLVLPYLFVLESRAEREGTPDPELPNRLLYEYILSAPLEITAAIFEASKPTLPTSQRLIKDDQDIARLALACLYGSDSLDEWSMMSRIFECLPAWDIPRDVDNDEDVTDTTISSLGAFVTPSTDQPKCTAFDLLVFFKPLPIASLSRALDILDVHLESGEILSRWNVPAPLRWFLQSNTDIKEQRAWANRMARRAGGLDDQLNSKEDWEWLLEDMLKLTGKGDTGLPGAFGLLTRDDVMQLFLNGLLSTGREFLDTLHESNRTLTECHRI